MQRDIPPIVHPPAVIGLLYLFSVVFILFVGLPYLLVRWLMSLCRSLAVRLGACFD